MSEAITRAEGVLACAGMSTGYVVAAFLAELDATEKTRTTYERALRQYASWMEHEGVTLDHATVATVQAYKRCLVASKSTNTTRTYLVAVRSLHRWIHERTGYPDVAKGVKGPKRSAAQAKDALSVTQAKDLLAAPAEGETAKRDKAMVALMMLRGLRTVEIVRADVGDLRQMAGKAVLYVQGKGHADKDDFVVLDGEAERLLRDYLRTRGHVELDAPLFAATGNRNRGGRMTTRSVSRIAKEAMREQGLDSPRLTAHSLRHTAVTLSLVAGATVQEAQAMARHASVSTTMVYAHNLDKLDGRAESALDELLAS